MAKTKNQKRVRTIFRAAPFGLGPIEILPSAGERIQASEVFDSIGLGIALRLWEQAGKSGECSVRLPPGMNVASVQPVDLRGRSIGTPLPVSNGTFATPLKAFAPASFVIDR